MNILHLSAVKNWGGGENHIENLCHELEQLSPTVTNNILCVKNGHFQKKLGYGKIGVVPARLSFKLDPRYFLKLIRVCKKEKIDLIHIHDTTALALGVLGDYFYDLPPFVFSKKTSFPIKKRESTLHKYNYYKIKKILCVSEETKKVTSLAIKDSTKLATIYHGTRLENKSKETPFLLRKKLGLKPQQKIIGNIANHIRAKSLENFIDIAHTIINEKKRTDFTFVQIGSFTNRTEDLQSKIAALNLQDHVFLLGFLPDASNFISQFDISLVTSQSEGIPGFIYESFFHKVPVISTKVGGIPEIITDGKNGLLANMHDHKKLSDHILYLYDKPELITHFTDLSHKLLIENFTTTKMAEQTLLEYKKVLNGRSKN